MQLAASFNSAYVDSPALAVALFAFHIVPVTYLLAVHGVRDQLELRARQVRSLVGLASLSLFAFAFALGLLVARCGRGR